VVVEPRQGRMRGRGGAGQRVRRDGGPANRGRHRRPILRDRSARHHLPALGTDAGHLGDSFRRNPGAIVRRASLTCAESVCLWYKHFDPMSRGQARFALACALVGLATSGWAAFVHYHLLYDPRYTSFCDVSATVSCTTVYQSRFSTIRGVPVAILGAIWFAVAALLALAGLTARDTVRESVAGYLFVLSTLALS